MSIDRVKINKLREDIEAVLSEVGEMHGVHFELGRCRYNRDNAEFKLEVALVDADGEVKSKVSNDFRRMAASAGLSPNDLGRTFVHSGVQYVVTGWNSRARKNKVTLRREDGASVAAPVSLVKTGLHRMAS